jgi:hypothetical protein
MKKSMVLVLVAMLLFSACAKADPPEKNTEDSVEFAMAFTETTVPETTVSIHSELYLPAYTADQILEYFAEVVLNIEYTDGTGDATVVQKWLGPIRYGIYGTPTDEDLAVLQSLFDQLNEIPGFPGIYPAEYAAHENVSLSFLESEAFREGFSHVVHGENAWGAAEFWYYTETNELYTARIGYRTDLDQSVRNSILVEEIINTLGISDTVLRTDSIVYQYSNENRSLSDVDLVILKLLYDPAILCGMDAQSCAEILRERYY